MEYNVTISSKGQFVLPKAVRERFRLSNGSKIKVIVDGDNIILKPRSVVDEMQSFILEDMAREGKEIPNLSKNIGCSWVKRWML